MRRKLLSAFMVLCSMIAYAQSTMSSARLLPGSSETALGSSAHLVKHAPQREVFPDSHLATRIGRIQGRNVRLDAIADHSIPASQVKLEHVFQVGNLNPCTQMQVRMRSERARRMAVKANGDLNTQQPQGAHKTYSRSGRSYFIDETGTFTTDAQSSLIEVVFGDDNKVFFKGIVFGTYKEQGWVEGNLSADGTTVTVVVGQNLAYDEQRGCMIELRMLKRTEDDNYFTIDDTHNTFSYKLVNNCMTLQGTDEGNVVGAIYTDTKQWAGEAVYNSVYNIFEDKIVEAPQALETKPFIMTGMTDRGTTIRARAEIGYDGNDVYIKGLCYEFLPEAWIKGRKEGNKVIIPCGQYFGIYDNSYLMYLIGCDMTGTQLLDEITFVYDDINAYYVTQDFLLINAYKDRMGYYSFLMNVGLAETRDIEFTTDVIDVQPEGELKTYTRSGTGCMSFQSSVYIVSQQGRVMDVVYAPDGKTVYMKDPISRASTFGHWIKGKIEGNQLTFPLYQCVMYYEEDAFGMMTASLVKKESVDEETGQHYSTYQVDLDAKSVSFTVNEKEGTIALNGTDGGKAAYGLIYTDDFTWTGFLDYESVYRPQTDKVTVLPAGLKTEEWSYSYVDTHDAQKNRVVNVAIDGNKIYLQGLLASDSKNAIVGTITDKKAVFESNQLMGVNQNVFVYFSGGTFTREEKENASGVTEVSYVFQEKPQMVFDYDAEARTLTSTDNDAIIYNSGRTTESLYYQQTDLKPSLAYFEEHAAVPADPVITEFNEDYFDEIGYAWISLSIPTKDVEDNFISPDKMAYQLFVNMGDHVEAYTLYRGMYMFLNEDMDILPYNFTDNYDIQEGGKRIRLYQSGFADFGVQTISYAGNKECRSNRVWVKAGVEHGTSTGIAIPEKLTDKQVADIVYHNLNGVRIPRPQQGVTIETTIYNDGSRATRKIVR